MIATSPNKRVSGSGFQPLPKSPSATSDTCRMLDVIGLRSEIDYKQRGFVNESDKS